ncbi:MAG: D-alanyl-D-alanine carboxypeptidase [Candidatus Pacebacteria bacterium]|nr:D-alanyl-D-alanine carboxypeptidase [Candidatus Paceibacterota bacterium]
MNLPIIDLNKKDIQNNESGVSEAALFDRFSVVSNTNAFVLLGLFTIIFGLTLFFIQNTDGRVLVKEEGSKNTALLSGTFYGLEEKQQEELPVKVVIYKDLFENIKIEAKAAYVFDINTGSVLYEKNKNVQRPIASLAKVMTALVVSETIDERGLVTVRSEDIALEGNSGLRAGENWRLKDLLDFTLMTSSNDGASALASIAGTFPFLRDSVTTATSDTALPEDMSSKEFFIKSMNDHARSLGMENTIFYNETGLDITDLRSGAYSSAHDLALLFEYIIKNEPTLLEATRKGSAEMTSTNGILHVARNTNQGVEFTSGLLASKTGYTDLAGGNLGVVFDSGLGTPIIVVVLGSSVEGRFRDAEILSEAALNTVGQDIF